jgi:hypothetical protein
MNHNEIDTSIADIHDRTRYLCVLINSMTRKSSSPLFDYEVARDLNKFLGLLQEVRIKTIDTIRLAERLKDEFPPK